MGKRKPKSKCTREILRQKRKRNANFVTASNSSFNDQIYAIAGQLRQFQPVIRGLVEGASAAATQLSRVMREQVAPVLQGINGRLFVQREDGCSEYVGTLHPIGQVTVPGGVSTQFTAEKWEPESPRLLSERQAAFYLSQKKWFEQRIVETQAELEKLLDSHRKLEDLCKQTLIKTDEGAIAKSFWDNVPNPTYTHNLVGPD